MAREFPIGSWVKLVPRVLLWLPTRITPGVGDGRPPGAGETAAAAVILAVDVGVAGKAATGERVGWAAGVELAAVTSNAGWSVDDNGDAGGDRAASGGQVSSGGWAVWAAESAPARPGMAGQSTPPWARYRSIRLGNCAGMSPEPTR